MQLAISFFIKSVITSALLYAAYLLLLRNRKLHSYNRFYLLSAVGISLLLPFLHFEWYNLPHLANTNSIKLLNVLNSDEKEIVPAVNIVRVWNIVDLIKLLYGAISVFIAFALIRKIAWIYGLKRKHKTTPKDGYTIVNTNLDNTPFSFANTLFWNENIDINTNTGMQVLEHELVHIRQKHTLDKLFVQLTIIFCWINPIYWLIQKELALVHEFLADEKAIEHSDTESFALMLLQSHYGPALPSLVHPFYFSPIKRRLTMLNQVNKIRYATLRKLMVLPLSAGLIFMFSFSKIEGHRANKKILIALDAGHGGKDNGAVSASGIAEKDLALKVTSEIAKLAPGYNVEIMQTRGDDNYVTLENRAAMANKASADILLSIHINSKDVKSGYELYLGKRNEKHDESKMLASSVIA